ncbi:hypothetical protein [Pluralibacter gergoviae]|uniref:hypothetical protein n=1 Tax=Pluralibacter gergoviae TaxID=61647 RepID=UPI00155DFE0A|nr:hypothetical protein [Pluralibacter gergoviae]
MISNDVLLNTFSLLMIFFLLLWGGCFFIFTYKELEGPKLGKESFLYFNFIFFKRGILSNISLLTLFCGYLSAALVEYRREFNYLMLIVNMMGGIAFLLYGIYGKCFFHGVSEINKPLFFIRVFIAEVDFSFGSLLLWLSRLMYMTWIVMFVINS